MKRIRKYEGSNWDPIKMSTFGFTIVIVTLFSFFLGSKEVKSIVGAEKCSTGYWIILVVEIIIILGIFVFSIIFV